MPQWRTPEDKVAKVKPQKLHISRFDGTITGWVFFGNSEKERKKRAHGIPQYKFFYHWELVIDQLTRKYWFISHRWWLTKSEAIVELW